jgi:hypothetical protein
MSLTYVELQSRLASQIFRGLAAGLSTTLSGGQITSLAASSVSAASAILAGLQVGTAATGTIEFQAEQAAAIFCELASGLDTITGAQITSIAALAVSALTAIQTAVATALGGSATFQAATLQSRSAVQVFAGLARGLSSITPTQTNSIAALAASAAGAIVAAL